MPARLTRYLIPPMGAQAGVVEMSSQEDCPFSNDLSHSHLICRNRVSFSFDLSYAS